MGLAGGKGVGFESENFCELIFKTLLELLHSRQLVQGQWSRDKTIGIRPQFTAVAREMVGFVWAIACEASGRVHGSRATA